MDIVYLSAYFFFFLSHAVFCIYRYERTDTLFFDS
jgi:hypothetical protein